MSVFCVCLLQKQIIPFLQSVFLPVVTKIFQVLNLPVDERDQNAASDKRLLQRSYFSFIATLVNNNVHEVLSNQGQTVVTSAALKNRRRNWTQVRFNWSQTEEKSCSEKKASGVKINYLRWRTGNEQVSHLRTPVSLSLQRVETCSKC